MSGPDLTLLIGNDGHERCPKSGIRLDLLAARQAAAMELAIEAALSAVHYGCHTEDVLREVRSALGYSPLSLVGPCAE